MALTQQQAADRAPWQWLARLLAIVPAAGAGVLLFTLPVFALPMALLGAGYAALLCWQPLAWLWVLPAATVLLDLTSWTGRPLVNEFDALFLLTVALALVRGEFRGAAGLRFFPLVCVAVFVALLLASVPDWRLFLWSATDNTTNPYYTADYAYRLVKGAVWGMLLALLWIAQHQREPQRSRSALFGGICTAACLLGLIVLWERGSLGVLLSGSAWYHVVNSVLDLASSYRVTALFSDMHTGGEVMDGVVILLLPLALHALVQGRGLPLRLLAALAFAALLYCTLVGFTRTTYAVAGAVVLMYGVWFGLSQRSLLLARPGTALIACVAALLALVAGPVSFALAGSYGLAVFAGLQLLAYLAWQFGQARPAVAALLLVVVAALLALAGLQAHLDSRWVTATPVSIATLLAVWSASLAATRWAVPVLARLSVFDRLLVLAGLLLAPAVLALATGGSQMSSRMDSVERDLETRAEHWSRVLASGDSSLRAVLLGNGVGRFPRNYVATFPDSVGEVGSYAVVADAFDSYLRLGGGRDLAISQRVSIAADTQYLLNLSVRSDDALRLVARLCERNVLFASNFMPRCVSGVARVEPTAGEVTTVGIALESGGVGEGSLLSRWPTTLTIRNPRVGTLVEIHDLSLIGGEQAVLRNAAFSEGMDHWFFYNDFAHLPWHIKNTWLQVWYDTGLLGSSLLLLLLLLALLSAWRAPRHEPAPALAIALLGLALLGLFGTPLDSPRVGWLFYFFLFALVLRPREGDLS